MQCDFPEENRASMTDQHNNFIQIYFRQQVGLLYGLGVPYRMKGDPSAAASPRAHRSLGDDL